MSIEWKQSKKHSGWFITHRGVSISIHPPYWSYMGNKKEIHLTCPKLDIDCHRMVATTMDEAKAEAIVMVEGKVGVLAQIVAEISDALGGE